MEISRKTLIEGAVGREGTMAGGGSLAGHRITRRFGAVTAVDDVSLELPAGGFFSLLGPSGCGKTTLLRIIAGLDRPDAGSVLIDGEDITRHPPERRPFNMVFQRYALFPHLTVAQNIAFGLTTNRRARPPEGEIRRRVSDMLDLVGLHGFEKRMPHQLSGGQAQRVSVARALIRRPRVLLLDEPMAALDRNVRHQVREELLRIHEELGTTFLLVTHDQDEALSISNVVALMNGGRLVQVAEPQTLYRRPATLFAAQFVGAGTFVSGIVLGRHADWVDVDVAGIRFTAVDATQGAARVVVLLRPEDISICGTEEARTVGRVETCSFFGSYFELTVRTPLGSARVRGRSAAGIGTSLGITWPQLAGIAYAEGSATDAREEG